MEQSICYRMKAVMAGLASNDTCDAAVVRKRAVKLRRFIESVDKPSLGSVYWSTVLHEVGDGLYRIMPTATELLYAGTHRLMKKTDERPGV